jgi:hypothetical protein
VRNKAMTMFGRVGTSIQMIQMIQNLRDGWM